MMWRGRNIIGKGVVVDLADIKKSRRKKLPLSVKLLLPLLLLFLFLSFREGKKEHYIEVAAVEIIHAEGEEDKKVDESFRAKEKLLEELIAKVKEREAGLDQREKEIELTRDNLQSVKKDINERLEKLRAVKADIEAAINQQKMMNEANITKLAKVYESSPPEQAGILLSQIDIDIAAQILLKMNSRKAGKIWGFVEPKKAAQISKKLAEYNSRKKK